MRRKKGMMAIVGIVAIGVIFFLGMVFGPEIFGNLETASNTTVYGTQYAAPYSGIGNMTYMFVRGGLPAIGMFWFIIGFVVAVLAMVVFFRRRR